MSILAKEPRAGEKRMKFLAVQVKAVDDDRKVVTIRGTTSTPDRDGDIVVPQGGDLTNFRKNPVFLWAHDWAGKNLPVGKSLEERVIVDVGIDFDIQFDVDDPFAMRIFNKYKNGFINASSIGFIPLRWERLEDPEGRLAGWRIIEWELLELSGCPIPANPDALQHALALAMKQLEAAKGAPGQVVGISEADRTAEEQAVFDKWGERLASLAPPDVDVHCITEFADLPVADLEHPWEPDKAYERVAEWAKNDRERFARAFCWLAQDPEHPDVESERLLIADVVDGELRVVCGALEAAVDRLNGIGGGLSCSDYSRQKVYQLHLEPYFEKFAELVKPDQFVWAELVSFSDLVRSLPFELTEREGIIRLDGREVPVDLIRSLIDRDVERRRLAQTLAEIGLSEDEAFRLLQAARENGGLSEPQAAPGVTLSDLAKLTADALEARVRYLRGEVTPPEKGRD